ncbi:MotA/TolQ/ExbB proton channel family protein [Croceicoccus hydrothermalis]|uniref:MotA/TolQ/ExbB proton channel family protein n=1 Tax=Croceicoccus hydrothermalis TaxID=2867964 RepID=UPI001EFA3C1F|nr:MotA/TolQ/ExbB proton channel family protein [Croceicoccus hydrothermalis]
MIFDLGAVLHVAVDLLQWPVIAALLLLGIASVLDAGMALGERFGGIGKMLPLGAGGVNRIASQRIARSDLFARVGPTLGLMGTLIPLGPGIAALGQGDFLTLSDAITTAFDTTVIGLVIGLLGYLIGRFRRSAYDDALTLLENGTTDA